MKPLVVFFSVIGVISVLVCALVAYGTVVWYFGFDAEMWRLSETSMSVVNPFPEKIASSTATTTPDATTTPVAPLISPI